MGQNWGRWNVYTLKTQNSNIWGESDFFVWAVSVFVYLSRIYEMANCNSDSVITFALDLLFKVKLQKMQFLHSSGHVKPFKMCWLYFISIFSVKSTYIFQNWGNRFLNVWGVQRKMPHYASVGVTTCGLDQFFKVQSHKTTINSKFCIAFFVSQPLVYIF